MSGLYVAVNHLAVIGKMFDESDLAYLLVESAIYRCNYAGNLLKGKYYNRGVELQTGHANSDEASMVVAVQMNILNTRGYERQQKSQ